MDPTRTPVKRTALGRAAHEGAAVALTQDGRAVVYWARTRASNTSTSSSAATAIAPGGAAANRELLDHGTLYVARFDADGSGRWLPLVHGQGPLTRGQRLRRPGRGADQGAPGQRRCSARRRWTGPSGSRSTRRRGEVYCTLTNNSNRGAAEPARRRRRQPARQQRDGPHHPLEGRRRLRRARRSAGTTSCWPATRPTSAPRPRATSRATSSAAPTACAFDARGVLWIQTDVSRRRDGQGRARERSATTRCWPATRAAARSGASSPARSAARSPASTCTPDGRTMFVNIQHPGETPSERSDPAEPAQVLELARRQPGGRPRSATVVIRRTRRRRDRHLRRRRQRDGRACAQLPQRARTRSS